MLLQSHAEDNGHLLLGMSEATIAPKKSVYLYRQSLDTCRNTATKKYANTHKPSDFDSSEPVRYNQSRTGSTLPIMRPSLISVAILQTMWIWNDFLLPYLTLDMRRFKTMSIAIQYLKGGYGSVDMGAMMACLVVAIVPIIIFYLCCQKYIIKGVMAGAVKG